MIHRRFLSLWLLSVALLFTIGFPLTVQSQVTLTIEDGNGIPISCAPVEVSLDNQFDKVKGVQVDICDVDNYLVGLGCEPTVRSPGFTCVTSELGDGCVRAILFSGGNLIAEGSGPIFTITYGVLWDAPIADDANTPEDERCRNLDPGNTSVSDENGDPFPSSDITSMSGEFCFFVACVSDADCDDGLFCTGDVCVGGECQLQDPCPDDGLFCTGVEGCDEGNDVCTQSGDPCTPFVCDEANDQCLCSVDADCDDGVYCNGNETCVGGICQPGTDPCTPPLMCDDNNDVCVECFDDSDCDDGLYCNGAETCGGGVCQPGTNPCPGTCDEANDVCPCSVDADCTDGLYCNGEETCLGSGICDINFSYNFDYPCKDCNPNFDDCDCDENTDTCQPVTLTVENGSGSPGSTNNSVDVSLDSLFLRVNSVQMEICDVDNLLACTGCEITGRTSGFGSCSANELTNNCCRVVLLDISGQSIIDVGTGPIFTIKYDVSASAPPGECRALNPQAVLIGGFDSNAPLAVNSFSGQFCFSTATTTVPTTTTTAATTTTTTAMTATTTVPTTTTTAATTTTTTAMTTTTTVPTTTTTTPPPPPSSTNTTTVVSTTTAAVTTTTTLPTTTTSTVITTTTVSSTTTTTAGLRVNFEASQTSGIAPFVVNFNPQIEGNIDGIKNYFWDFGDGVTSSERNPLHTYLVDGDYSVRLAVTTADGAFESETKPDYIEVVTLCPFVASLDNKEELDILRSFRDKVLFKDIDGLIFTFLFYRNSLELTKILNQHQDLKDNLRLLVSEYSTLISDAANGEEAYLWESDKANIIELLEEIRGKGSPQLKADINFVIKEIEDGKVSELLGVAGVNE